jgi:hypothetical protein
MLPKISHGCEKESQLSKLLTAAYSLEWHVTPPCSSIYLTQEHKRWQAEMSLLNDFSLCSQGDKGVCHISRTPARLNKGDWGSFPWNLIYTQMQQQILNALEGRHMRHTEALGPSLLEHTFPHIWSEGKDNFLIVISIHEYDGGKNTQNNSLRTFLLHGPEGGDCLCWGWPSLPCSLTFQNCHKRGHKGPKPIEKLRGLKSHTVNDTFSKYLQHTTDKMLT